MTIWFSPSVNAFYPDELKSSYEEAGSLPSDLIETDKELFYEFTVPPDGKIRAVGSDGLPCWIDIPPPTQEELIAIAGLEKQRFIDQANEFINSKQWPGKVVLGRLKDEELARYNLWLDYLDALEAVDVTTAPDIKWPDKPA